MPLLATTTTTTIVGPTATATRKRDIDTVKPLLEEVLAVEPGHHSSAGHRRSKTWSYSMEPSLHSHSCPSPFQDLR